uniref:alpha/beta hydrolase fold domain-containing protein n=1 Tax=Paractinoplanes polyasparticus TaxID=2856853 RepID=UPI001C85B784|nr:alpha/beta hydrolase [Actinoplanes polyasparticus]
MTSLQMRLVAAYLRYQRKPQMATVEQARRRMARTATPAAPPLRLLRAHHVTSRTVNGFTCWTVAPRAPSATAVIYLHGGAYIAPISPQHWDLIARLADAGVRVEVPLYGLAPAHTYRDAYPLLIQVYRELVAGSQPVRVRIAGDSAGGGLALGFAQELLESDLPAPVGLVLISPWLDLTLSGDGVAGVAAFDPWLTPAGLIEAGRAWAGGDDPSLSRLSPINGTLAGLPPTDIFVGDREVMYPDVMRLRRLAAEAGWSATVTEAPGAVHDYPLVPAPEGRRARKRIIELLSIGPPE